MSFSDPLGDMLTRIRNGQKARKMTITSPASKLRANVLEVLKEEGYIRGYFHETVSEGIGNLKIELKYFENQPVIQSLDRVSKPGRRVYAKIKDLKQINNGLGLVVLSTPKGVLSDGKARELNVGGEVLCSVF
ncbi:MAG: 30S ribosomal protein S8 [uncultured bacterium]|nr:MAG: 30S ribosomal protein S8 [uncultured bacterium]OFW69796.1 MAG: 30S ribosomal protein S8 [Alphaproteobacteria bacterium GWC2_42_16]OFW74395.1 MAG: 30S ribosomal protein S8 [Alphaproteobacteria bacterium GWA2_41_27]OFW82506.1 MAG: 30S ribosomal protein S8 [Alphaproteobacteria bacterium RIFCSPHIGHO2_12_FULL_42_100]OFW85094.1 MAG: 30S ribosomal protein S8 [Alphaproteobacteria bacterium RBG_16_42_14]OFW91617.1 MAG: 30S ribosomal protein S8 [Alphaproteobacteria bacterium RIFCSPHIGHO2_12_42_1